MTSSDDARALFEQSLERHAARDTGRSIELARRAIACDPEFVQALEHLAVLLVTRRRAFREGLDAIERALAIRDDDPGLWYTAGWLYEFVAHELARRPTDDADLSPPLLYERAADAFRRCLSLNPGGKLEGDAQDLLDHVENELQR